MKYRENSIAMNIQQLVSILFAYTLTLCTSTDNSAVKSSTKISEKFLVDGEATIFNHLAVDKFGRWVYIGAQDHLYQLSPDLKLQIKYTPQLNPSNCTPDTSDKIPCRHNDTDVLVLDYQNQRLISCTIYSTGTCHAHDIGNISEILTTDKTVVENFLFRPHVTFIAPSLQKNSSITSPVLYMGFVENLFYSEVPTIIIKTLEQKDFLLVPGQNSTLQLKTQDYSYNPRFICGFSVGNISYFLTSEIQHIRPEDKYRISGNTVQAGHLIKIQHKDDKYLYDELFLICDDINKIKNLSDTLSLDITHACIYEASSESATDSHKTEEKIIFAVFDLYLKSYRFSSRNRVGFAVCKYDMNKIQSVDPESTKINGDFVFLHEGNTMVTAMAVTTVENHTILFFGTDQGHLHKVSIRGINSVDNDTVNRYPDTIIDEGSAVNPDMLFDSQQNFLYVMTEKKLAKVKIHNCDQYNTSGACLSAKDPFCGWCFPSKTCGLKTECTQEQNNTKWMSYDIFKHITAFSYYGYAFLRRLEWNDTINSIHSHPPMNNTMICGTYKTCISCVTSTYPCRWHVNKHRCTDSTTWNNNDIVIGGNLDQFYSKKPSRTLDNKYPRDPLYCPQFYTYDPYKSKSQSDLYEPNIYVDVQNKTLQNITVKYKLPQDLINETFSCEFDFEGNKTIQPAKAQVDNTFYAGYVEGQITCGNTTFAYGDLRPNVTVKLSVLQNGSKPLDNPLNTSVILYKCTYGDNNRKTCVQMRYCKWNTESSVCEYVSVNNSAGKEGLSFLCQ
ncbi:plexin-A4-like [Planococcus citri]|uniref:plexin-A4-like n=1 Tax=Planococcus citri TaxID=170843 RepID=UPI0031F9BB17